VSANTANTVEPARLDHNRHVALPYRRTPSEVRYVCFSPAGPQRAAVPANEFDRLFRERIDRPAASVALELLGHCQSAYLPGEGVAETLLEVITMTTTEGKADLSAMDMKALTAHYNGIAKAIGRAEVKGFKSKGEAIKRIAAVSAVAKEPTADQREHAAAAQEKADRGLRALKAAAKELTKEKPKAAKKERPAAKARPAKKAAKKADGEGKPRGQGIGAFCMDLILKGKTNESVLEAVGKKFPDASTSAASVAWYRNKLKSEGQLK
jgi:hypothetical protein